jgi:protocatechuate 3,4-dioxygenase beta subunit
MRTRSLAVVLLSFVWRAGIAAQPPAPPPPRDQPRPAPTGTAALRGRVVDNETGRPLRRARISVSAAELGRDSRTTSTNLDGRYELLELPAGRYTIRVSRSGYLALQYGQRRPLEQGTPLQLADKQAADGVDFALPRSSVIAGRILDELSEPVAGVQVLAMRDAYWQGRRRLVPAGGPAAVTDDEGEYRVIGLAPGRYVVMAILRDTWTVTEHGVEQMMAYAPTYYPGTAGVAEARRVTVGVGQKVTNINVALMPGRTATVSGTAVDSTGGPIAGRNVGLLQEMVGPGGAMFLLSGNATSSADGSFAIKDVAPGEYKLRVQTGTDRPGPPVVGQEMASIPIAVDGVDVTNVSLVTSAGWSLSGSVTTEDGVAPDSPRRDQFRVGARAVDAETFPGPPPPPSAPGGPPIADAGRVKDDWSFSVTGVFGAARVIVAVPDAWTVTRILKDGRDITDAPVQMKSGEVLTGVQVVVVHRATTVAGRLLDANGGAVQDGTVIVFAEDAAKWIDESRWVRTARPDQQGQYQIRGLPPGDYLAIAVNYLEDGSWNAAEYLESIRQLAQKVMLHDGESLSIVLKVVNAPQ